MKTIIAGSRHINDIQHLRMALATCPFTNKITEVVSGGAKGVDELGETWATVSDIPIKRFPADWAKYGRSAGQMRNLQMADYAEALVAVWDGKSRGTQNMIRIAQNRNFPVHIYTPNP